VRTSDERARLLAHLARLRGEARHFAKLARTLARALNGWDGAMFEAGSARERASLRAEMAALAQSLDEAFRVSDERKQPDLQRQVPV